MLKGGKKQINDGWLNNQEQNQVLLRINGDVLKLYKEKHKERLYFIKVTPFDLRNKEVIY